MTLNKLIGKRDPRCSKLRGWDVISFGCSSFGTTLIFNNNNYLGEYGHAPRCRFVAYMHPTEPYVQTKGA